MNILIGIVVTLVILGVLVIVHEGGHFVAAKAVGVRVNEFSMGMGPLFFSKKKGDTLYSVRLLPIGGFVAMHGENEESDDPRSFSSKPAWAKALILAAGPFMNFLLAVVIIAGLITYGGTGIKPVVDYVTPDMPAYVAGIEAGDKVTAVNGVTYEDADDMMEAISESGTSKGSVILTVMDGETNQVSDINVDFVEASNGRMYMGVTFDAKHNPFVGLIEGGKMAVNMEVEMVKMLSKLITGHGS
ncbi:MAG: site-2 protease family protein, partial [Firmicutes bacterium]|nr:site-2 protease family protein [Bacillota bacterium]